MAKLTARSIKKIPPPTGSGAREVPDDLLKGLVLARHHSGAASWTVRYRNKEGQQRRLTLGRWPALNVETARGLAAEALRAVARGEDPQAEKAATRHAEVKDSFADMAIRFVETYCQPKNRSWLEQARLLGFRKFASGWQITPGSPADRWQDRSVATITKREVVEAVDAATERGPIAANRVHTILARFFSWAVAKAAIETSPAAGTKKPNPERSRDRVLTPEELSEVWHAAGELRAPFDAFVRLLILTAARRNEVAGLTDGEIVDGAWTIPASRAKQAEANMLPLPTQALEIIAALPRSASGLLLTTTGETPISGFSKMKRELDRVIAKSRKIAPWTLHDLRRSAATGMASLSIEPHIVEAILGHRSGVISGVAAVYNKFTYSRQKKAALQRWADYVSIHNLM